MSSQWSFSTTLAEAYAVATSERVSEGSPANRPAPERPTRGRARGGPHRSRRRPPRGAGPHRGSTRRTRRGRRPDRDAGTGRNTAGSVACSNGVTGSPARAEAAAAHAGPAAKTRSNDRSSVSDTSSGWLITQSRLTDAGFGGTRSRPRITRVTSSAASSSRTCASRRSIRTRCPSRSSAPASSAAKYTSPQPSPPGPAGAAIFSDQRSDSVPPVDCVAGDTGRAPHGGSGGPATTLPPSGARSRQVLNASTVAASTVRPGSTERLAAVTTRTGPPCTSATARVQAVSVMRSSGRHGAGTRAARGTESTGWSSANTVPTSGTASASTSASAPVRSSDHGSAPGRRSRAPDRTVPSGSRTRCAGGGPRVRERPERRSAPMVTDVSTSTRMRPTPAATPALTADPIPSSGSVPTHGSPGPKGSRGEASAT